MGGRPIHVVSAVLPICEQKFDQSQASLRLFGAGRRDGTGRDGAQGGVTLDQLPEMRRPALFLLARASFRVRVGFIVFENLKFVC